MYDFKGEYPYHILLYLYSFKLLFKDNAAIGLLGNSQNILEWTLKCSN